jgi:uncharacterized protein YdiU (UPF0061 family)
MRVGTFEYFAARGDDEALRTLSTYALARHYPDAKGSDNDAQALLDRVIEAQAKLVARWLGVGFIHGVMNTDNTSISGETIDYGPCAFLDAYDPKKRFSSIDHGGRYAFGNQPRIAHWNVTRLAEALLTLLGDDEETAVKRATTSLEKFPGIFDAAYARVLRDKLGLHTTEDGDAALAADLFGRMAENAVDYTLFFRRLCASAASSENDAGVTTLFSDPGAFRGWAEGWRERLSHEKDVSAEARAASMRQANPAFIPRNHRVEQLIEAAEKDDYGPFEALLSVCTHPFEENAEHAHLADPPKPEELVKATFCGT